ncbi:MAG: PAS domain S-box protein [Magnetospirillum sp.]|nr:PAS domain S-box protein [Magnetospirillum sp.]
MIAAVQDGILTIDGSGIIETLNPAAERIFGYAAAEIIGQSVGVLTQEHGREGHDTYLRTYHRTGESSIIGRTRELVGRRRDGASFPLELTVTRVDTSGRVMFAALVRDLTNQRRAEAERAALADQFFQAQKMEAVAALAEWMAHDIGNILNTMVAYAEFAADNLAKDDPMAAMLRDAAGAGMRGKDLLRQLMMVGGSGSAERELIDLAAIVGDATQLFRCAEGQGVRLILDLPAEPCLVHGRGIQLYQVVMNLMINAIQAIADTGEVRVSLDCVVLRSPEGGEAERPNAVCLRVGDLRIGFPYVRLSVTDTGSGMDADTLSHIFEPFFTTKTSGTGLGLSAVSGIIDGHHGGIVVETCKAEGTRFTIFLPRADV